MKPQPAVPEQQLERLNSELWPYLSQVLCARVVHHSKGGNDAFLLYPDAREFGADVDIFDIRIIYVQVIFKFKFLLI